jgi:hypothetical protein
MSAHQNSKQLQHYVRYSAKGTTGMGLFEKETETIFSKRQFGFSEPETKYFKTIPVPVETKPEFQIFIPVPEKLEPEIEFCRNSGRNMPEFDCECC